METFRLIACPSLSHERRTDQYLEPGQTLKECLRALGWHPESVSARVTIDGTLIPDAEWLEATPTAGQAVVVRTVPTGGDGKQIAQIIGMIALTVAAIYIAGGAGGYLGTTIGAAGWQAQALATGVLVASSLAMNAHIPPPLRRLHD